MDAFDKREAQGLAKAAREFACKLLGLVTLSDEQIADITSQPVENIEVLRQILAGEY